MISIQSCVLVYTALAVASIPAPRDPVVWLPGPIEQLAVSEAGIVVVTPAGVRVLDPSGRRIRTLFPEVDRPRHRAHDPGAASGFSSLPGLAGDSDWGATYDLDDIDDADDPRLADDTESLPWDLEQDDRRRRSASGAQLEQAISIAAGGGSIWIGRSDGIWRVEIASGVATRVFDARREGVHALAASWDGRILAAIVGQDLLRSLDGGVTFERVGMLSGAARALAVSTRGCVSFIDRYGLGVVPPGGGQPELVADVERPLDVVSCGAEMMLLTPGAMHSISARADSGLRIARVGVAPTGANRITCGAEGGVGIAYGDEVWSSVDGGRSWVRRKELPPGTITGVGATRGAIWTATSAGLLRLPLAASPIAPPGACGTGGQCPTGPPSEAEDAGVGSRPTLLARSVPEVAPPNGGGWRWWYAALPRIDLSFTAAAASATSRKDLRGLVVLTFPLSGPSDRGVRTLRAAEAVRRRIAHDSTRLLVAGVLSGGDGDDPIASEERRTLSQVLEDRP